MEERHVGRSGLRVSLLGLGANNFGVRGNNFGSTLDLEQTRRIVHTALDLGVNFIETADVYGKRGGSEEVLGEVLQGRRNEVVIATKYNQPMDDKRTMRGASRRYTIMAVEASLKRLKTDWIDVYQMHHPDPMTPIEETLRAFDDLIRAGKVRYIGASNFPAWRLADAHYVAKAAGLHGFVSCQDELNLLTRDTENELVPALDAYGIGLFAYFPLASGFLSGKYKRDAPPPDGTRLALSPRVAEREMSERKWPIVEQLDSFAKARGHTLLELALAWLATRRQLATIITGATRPEQVQQNVKALDWRLSADEVAEVDKITAPLMRPAKTTPFSTRHA